jgi:oligoendopeptidase F
MNNKTPEWLEPFKRKFVSGDFKITDGCSIKPWIDKLLERKIASSQDLFCWLKDYSELQEIIEEDFSFRYVEMTCNTKDKRKEESYLYFVREIQPKLIEWNNALNRKYYDSLHRRDLNPGEYGRLDRILSTAIELYTEKNIPIEVRLAEMSQKYQVITGSWMVEFDGKIQTMPQMMIYLYKTDRNMREGAWKAMAERRLQDARVLNSLFDTMVKTRHEYAKNIGLTDYREYAFKSKLRDYTPDDCLRFHDSIERVVVPLMERLAEKRRMKMKIESLRPWDIVVDPLGRPPLQPFKDAQELKNGVKEIFSRIDPHLGKQFNSLYSMMDLESRDGKAPGGYQATFEERRLPFIFTNAAGIHEDVTTLLHEGGHAFHTLSCRHQPLIWYRHASMEFSEVASMAQELFGNPHLGIFYRNDEDANRSRVKQLERVVEIFPWVATVDGFQHWIYTHPEHTSEERAEKWLDITGRFELKLDWSGINKDIKKYTWHKQLHIFEVPFYYIEYAIAQLGALMLYRIYKGDQRKAVRQYLSALALGGSRSPQELFKAAGIKMDFSFENLSSLMEMIETELEEYDPH